MRQFLITIPDKEKDKGEAAIILVTEITEDRVQTKRLHLLDAVTAVREACGAN